MKITVLIVASEDRARTLASCLPGLQTWATTTWTQALEEMAGRRPDLVLLDAPWLGQFPGLKDIPSIAVIPEEGLGGPGLLGRVSDFVLEPFRPGELMARVQRLLAVEDSPQLIRCGDLTIDTAKYQVYLAGQRLDLTYKEFELLRFLAEHRGRVFTREALLNQVWGYDFYGGERTVDVHIRRLRGKIEDLTHTFIETVRGMGYRFKD